MKDYLEPWSLNIALEQMNKVLQPSHKEYETEYWSYQLQVDSEVRDSIVMKKTDEAHQHQDLLRSTEPPFDV